MPSLDEKERAGTSTGESGGGIPRGEIGSFPDTRTTDAVLALNLFGSIDSFPAPALAAGTGAGGTFGSAVCDFRRASVEPGGSGAGIFAFAAAAALDGAPGTATGDMPVNVKVRRKRVPVADKSGSVDDWTAPLTAPATAPAGAVVSALISLRCSDRASKFSA
jgi:hypothetical protein